MRVEERPDRADQADLADLEAGDPGGTAQADEHRSASLVEGSPPLRDGDRPSEARRSVAGALVVVGSLLAMFGLIGGLLANVLGWQSGGSGGVFVIGSGTLPWSALLLAGVVLTALGGIAWASRLSSDYGALVGTGMVLVLAFTLILGGWAGLRRAQQPGVSASSGAAGGAGGSATSSGSSGGAPAGIPAGHDHSTDLGSADAAGALAGEGAEGQEQFGGHSHGTPGPTTDMEARQTDAMLAAAKQATMRYKTAATARRDGYIQVTQFIPGLGLHYANLKLLNAGFDAVHPPILLYEPSNAGALRLVGVAYSVPQGRSDVPPAGFPGGEDVWHYHTNLCFLPNGSVTIAPSGAACKAKHGYFQAKTAWLLHAWIWTSNPNGVFTENNPRVF
jgi:hypothetical protein